VKSPEIDSLRIKLASIAVHADELCSLNGKSEDAQAIRSLLQDPEVSAYMTALGKMALLPLKRS
jgi:hypothetical protein